MSDDDTELVPSAYSVCEMDRGTESDQTRFGAIMIALIPVLSLLVWFGITMV